MLMSNNNGCKDIGSICGNGYIRGKGKGDGNGNRDRDCDGDSDGNGDGDGDGVSNRGGNSNGV